MTDKKSSSFSYINFSVNQKSEENEKIVLRHVLSGQRVFCDPEEALLILTQAKDQYALDKTFVERFIFNNKIYTPEEFFATFKQKHGLDLEKLLTRETVEHLIQTCWNPANVIKFNLEETLNFKKIAETVWFANPYFYDKTKTFWVWNFTKAKYERADETDILNLICGFLESNDIPKRGIKERLLDAFKVVGRQKSPKPLPPEYIQVGNQLYNLKTGEIKPATWEYFCLNPIPWKIGESEETPIIDELFEQWVGKEHKQLLFELCAYSLYRGYPIHRIFILFGSGSNGKSTFLSLLKKFIGPENFTSTSLERLINNRFETAKLFGKLVATISETDFGILKNTALIKQLTGEDTVTAEFKNKDPFDFVNYSKIIVSTNVLPLTMDTSDAFYRRVLIIDFPNTFEKNIEILSKIPDREFENLLRKCLNILTELLKRGHFFGEEDIQKKREKYEIRANPLRVFIKEYCEEDLTGYIPCFEFYNKFIGWLKATRPRFRTPSKREVYALLEHMGFERAQKRIYINGEETKPWCILGLKWKESQGESVSNVSNVSGFPIEIPYIENQIEKPETFETNETPECHNNTLNTPNSSQAHECALCKYPLHPQLSLPNGARVCVNCLLSLVRAQAKAYGWTEHTPIPKDDFQSLFGQEALDLLKQKGYLCEPRPGVVLLCLPANSRATASQSSAVAPDTAEIQTQQNTLQ